MRQQAEWRRLERERTEAENKRIVEFASQRQQMEETKIEKIREREVAKENLYKTVETPSSEKQSTLYLSRWQSSFSMVLASQMTQLFPLVSCRGSWKRKGSGVKRWNGCVRTFMSRKRSKPRGRERS